MKVDIPVIKNFRSTNLLNAFVLSALVTSIAIVSSIIVKKQLTVVVDEKGNEYKDKTDFKSIFLTFLVTFIATMIAFLLLYVLFGYGGGMLVCDSCTSSNFASLPLTTPPLYQK